jgi:hypothetical protein
MTGLNLGLASGLFLHFSSSLSLSQDHRPLAVSAALLNEGTMSTWSWTSHLQGPLATDHMLPLSRVSPEMKVSCQTSPHL